MRTYREGRCNPVSGWGHAWLRAVVLTLLVTARLAIVGQPAEASTTPIPSPFFIPLVEDTSFTQADQWKVIISTSLSLQAGESRRVFGRVEATLDIGNSADFEIAVQCGTLEPQPHGAPQFKQSGISALADRNHEGKDHSGEGYPTKGLLPLTAHLLFKAPTSAIYTCRLLASDGDIDTQMTAITTDSFGNNATWLQISSSDDVGSQWWQDPDCGSNGTEPTCTYLGGSAGLPQSWIFYNDGSEINTWDAASDAAFIEVGATVVLTSCYNGTLSCKENHWGSSGESVVVSHLELYQLNSTLGVCKSNQTPDVTSTISNAAHHYTITYSLPNVPIYPECGSNQFLLRVYVKYISGNPVHIEGTRSDCCGVTEPESYTNAYAINSAYGTAVPVPNVVGSTESTAEEMILAAGYLVGNVSRIVNTAANGIVISQNAQGGTIEPPGSAVDLIISLGTPVSCTVPNIIGLNRVTAAGALTQAPCSGSHDSMPALVLGSERDWGTIDCAVVGTIVDQNPHSGSTLPAGSVVNFTFAVLSPRHSCE